ncbi:MAG: SRPBCC family protein [Actinomycetota bacterium]
MSTIEEAVEVRVPVRTAYNQWTQFEDFPQFMEGVESITQLDDTKTHWVTSIGGQRREFDALITEQNPDERVAWRTVEGPKQAGVVTFHRLGENETKIMLQMKFDPEGIVEKTGDVTGAIKSRARGDMLRFKDFIESRDGRETGAWRGEVEQTKTH